MIIRGWGRPVNARSRSSRKARERRRTVQRQAEASIMLFTYSVWWRQL